MKIKYKIEMFFVVLLVAYIALGQAAHIGLLAVGYMLAKFLLKEHRKMVQLDRIADESMERTLALIKKSSSILGFSNVKSSSTDFKQ